jgi:hypothetical protein
VPARFTELNFITRVWQIPYAGTSYQDTPWIVRGEIFEYELARSEGETISASNKQSKVTQSNNLNKVKKMMGK